MKRKKCNCKRRTTEELQRILSNLKKYEVWMMWSLTHILAADNQGQGVIHNALVESFLIHARLLIEFLYRDTQMKDDDALAKDFFSPATKWQGIRPVKSRLLEETTQAANKHLVHLTYTRLQKKKRWPYIEIANDIKAVLQVFHEKLSDDFTKESNA